LVECGGLLIPCTGVIPYRGFESRPPRSPQVRAERTEVITEDELAWAAGLFDGEGSVSTYLPPQRWTRRRQMQVSQRGVRGCPPAVLVRFQAAVGGVGGITGPYRGYLFYWKTTRNDVIDEIGNSLWRFLGDTKREQFARAASEVNRVAPTAEPKRTTRTERAWAAGLFDGEGCFYLTTIRESTGWRGVSLYLSQSSGTGPPDTILRFHAAIDGLGSLSGPHAPRSPWSRLPQYHWQTSGRHSVSAVLRLLWPWLGTVSRDRVLGGAAHLDPDFGAGGPLVA
jgi:hypothetical protein